VRIALTGATGFTGSRLLRRLLARGDEVSILARKAPSWDVSKTRIVLGDLRDPKAAADLVAGCEAVLHLAAVYRTAAHPDSYYRDVNVGGTKSLLDAAAQGGVRRFVHTSTVGVHGHVTRPPADESAPIRPGDIYQATKAEAEALVLAHRSGMEVVVVRPGAIYGPGDRRFLKLFRAIARGRYAVVGSGLPFYHPVFIDDLVEGFVLALETPAARGEAFILAGPSYVSQAQLASIIARHTGGRVLPFRIPAAPLRWAGALCEVICVPLGIEPPLHRRRVEFFTKSRAFSIDKARRLLGYAPRVDVEEGVARTAAFYREAGWL